MLKRSVLFGLSVLAVLFFHQAIAQSSTINYSITEVDKSEIRDLGEMQINARAYRLYKIDVESLRLQLEGVPRNRSFSGAFSIQFPHPNGMYKSYQVVENTTMSEGLAERYPRIQSFNARGIDHSAVVKWDLTEQGLHLMIMQPGKSTVFLDPAIQGNTEYYVLYKREDFYTNKAMECHVNEDFNDQEKELRFIDESAFVSRMLVCELKTYRLAVTAAGEYSVFHGGTLAQALSAQVTTMNRVNGVFERDLGVTMSIVPNNDTIIFLDPNTDNISNGNVINMLVENQSICDNYIGTSNYDIGHIFGTNSGGVALYRSVCIFWAKAKGVTGGSAPIGDPFDIDYVAHEMGHQFGGSHSFNNICVGNISPGNAVEPGSGSTIMAYAGVCVPNVQNNSDDHFHGWSIREMGGFINGTSQNCYVSDISQNTGPVVTLAHGDIRIPKNTPFVLRASATDADGDSLTFCWEQSDPEIATQPPLPSSTQGPTFRSFSPTNDSLRYFPRLGNVVNGNSNQWDRLPNTERYMSFMVTVRDNSPTQQSCVVLDSLEVFMHGSCGPFRVTSQDTMGLQWWGNSQQTIEWAVANTDIVLGTSAVDIFLSADGGSTFPYKLADDVPNTGSAIVDVPNINTLEARIMVMNDSNFFYHVNAVDFEIYQSGTGIEEEQASNWSLYPNPNAGSFESDFVEEVNELEILVHNSIGQLVYSEKVYNKSKHSVQIEGAAGLYFVEVRSDKASRVFRMIKE